MPWSCNTAVYTARGVNVVYVFSKLVDRDRRDRVHTLYVAFWGESVVRCIVREQKCLFSSSATKVQIHLLFHLSRAVSSYVRRITSSPTSILQYTITQPILVSGRFLSRFFPSICHRLPGTKKKHFLGKFVQHKLSRSLLGFLAPSTIRDGQAFIAMLLPGRYLRPSFYK